MHWFETFSLRAHAKVNLSLRVLGRDAGGYHALETVFQALALHDVLEFEPREGRLALACEEPGVPLDDRNLVWRAASAIWACAGRDGDPSGVHVRLRKRIPAEAGLGGGSSNAAAALVAFARLWLPGAGLADLAAIGRGLGADVPFFLCGGTALGLDRGDRVFPLADLEPLHVALVRPAFGVSTPAAYAWFDGAAGEGPGGAETARGEVRLAGGVRLAVANDLEAPVVARHPEIALIRDQLLASGAQAAAMSGSGSTVFGLFGERGTAAAALAGLEGEGRRLWLTRTAARRQSGAGAAVLVRTRSSRIH